MNYHLGIAQKFPIGDVMKLLLNLLLLNLMIAGCRPEQDATEFNSLIDVPKGEDSQLVTDQNVPIEVTYVLEPSEDSINLQVSIVKNPEHGELKDCKIDGNQLKCTYIPNETFSGVDTIEVVGKDGDVLGTEPAKITIIVNEVPAGPEAPKALDGSISGKSREPVEFMLPEAIDPDSLSSELKYEIVEQPQNGDNVQCDGRRCIYISDSLFQGIDSISYKVIDEKGLESNLAKFSLAISPELTDGIQTFNNSVTNTGGVDIVWVIDNSGSMDGEQKTLQRNFEAFIKNFLIDGKARFPFNMAVTTTDAYLLEDGSVPFRTDSVGNVYDLSSTRAEKSQTDYRDFTQDFISAVGVGTDGNGSERAIPSINRAYNLMPTWFGGNDRQLVFIILTDEPEQGGPDKQGTEDLEAAVKGLQALKDDPAKVKVYPIIRFSKDYDDRYKQIAALTGTMVSDIDAPFSDVLNNISLQVASGLSGFQLRRDVAILADTIKVLVNGVETSEFVYNAQTGVLNLNNQLNVSATIQITYKFGKL